MVIGCTQPAPSPSVLQVSFNLQSSDLPNHLKINPKP